MDVANGQPGDPYAPPKAQVGPEGVSTARNPWIAVVLALFSPVYTMLYVACGWRALGYLVASFGLLVVALMLNASIGVPINVAELVGVVVLRLAGAVDGYQRAKA
jgi:hypothetical protein